MTRVAPIIRQRAVVAGTVGLTAIGAAAATVPARAADTTGGAPLNSMPAINLRTLLSPDSDMTRLGLDKLPVAGALPDLLAGLPVTALPPIVPAALKSPGARTRKGHEAQAVSAPAPAHAPAGSAPAAAPVSGPALGPSTPENSPATAAAHSRGLGVLPLMSNVPLVDKEKSSELLAMLAGSGLSALGPVGDIAHGLGGVAAL